MHYQNFCKNLLRKLDLAYNKTQFVNNKPKAFRKAIREITLAPKTKILSKELLKLTNKPETSVNNVNIFLGNIGKNLADKIRQSSSFTVNASSLSTLLTLVIL